jgi:hypothetical protein
MNTTDLPTQGPQYQAFFKMVQQKVNAYYQKSCASGQSDNVLNVLVVK